MHAPKITKSPARPDLQSKKHADRQPSLFASQHAPGAVATEATRIAGPRPFVQAGVTFVPTGSLPSQNPLPPIRPKLIQPKLRIGAVDDPLEQEADQVAEKVMRAGAGEIATTASSVRISRKCACEEEAETQDATQVRRKCASCEKEDEEGALQRKPDTPVPLAHRNDEAPAPVHEVLRSPGQPLDAGVRSFFEPRLGFDLSRVRIHADSAAAASARSVDALAYTAGADIAFAAGHYHPETDRGRRLIAHELAHVVQQSAGDRGYLRRLGDVSKAPAVLACPIPPSNVPPTNEFVLFPNLGTDLDATQQATIGNYVDRYNATGNGAAVRVDGFASEPGDDALNWQLSCNRAGAVQSELMHPRAAHTPGVPEASISVFMQGETAEFGPEAQNRRATIFPPLAGSSQGTATPQPTNDQDNGQTSSQDTTPPTTDGGGGGTPQQTDGGNSEAAPPERPTCAVNPGCPDDYCLPFPTRQAALDDRAANAESVLSTISSANAHSEPMFRRYIFNPGPAGDISADFAPDFTSSLNTRDTTVDVAHLVETELNSHPPTFPPGESRVTVDIENDPGREALKRQINQLATTGLVYTSPLEAPGLLAGGVGLDQGSCNVGANTSGAQNDSRSASVTADAFKNPDGTLLVTPEIHFTVVDTIDFCPGNCGGFFARHIGKTVLMSRWEASSISGDVPFTVHFPAPSIVGAFGSED